MASLSLLVMFFLSPLPLLSSAEEQIHHPACPPFRCGKFGDILPPFRNNSNSKCGLYTVDCSEPVPKIQLKEGGYWYELDDISRHGHHMAIKSGAPPAPFADISCESKDSFALPSPSMISNLSTTYLLTVFNCSQNSGIHVPAGFDHTPCRDYDIYYTLSNISFSAFTPHCSMIQLPGYFQTPKHGISNLPLIILDVNVNDFRRRCYSMQGLCKPKDKDKFICLNAEKKKGDKNSRLKWGLSIGLSLPIICLVMFFFLWRHKLKRSAKYLSRNISDPCMNSDPEGGSGYYGVHVFSYKDLEEATNNFDSEKELGDGGFGTVYHGKLKDGREVAVKRLYEHNYKRVKQFKNEVEILTRLRHKNLVSLYGCTSWHCRKLLLVYEYIPNGTVADHLHGDRAQTSPLTWPVRMSIAIETATALAYLHASDIVHRDVKTNNILLDESFCVKVADFGLSRLFPNDVTHVSTAPQGTPGYVDPEYHQCYQLTSKSDVYSFGVVLVELISSMRAVDITRHRHDINLSNLAIIKIQKGAYNELVDLRLGFDSNNEVKRMTIAVAELAFQCLQQDKEMRPSMDEVLEELKIIESGNNESENHVKGLEGVTTSVQPPPSQDCDEVGLLKRIKEQPLSPNAVTENWPSSRSSSTANISG
ncbi:LEAF RUST 10 DISEASE-RESISTANCE LOCUS RECEPTOR-LIKE PROTEIN KINASE-like 1.1 isoform X2 [Morus notabilis]|uniref:LEAF RUST 10 DISEASE-RESISTANCE LOCUS RECEPTOR-LIKE PROTEIN KINASE-like 1.1 isoform X2 n=1 Tax=Morus notabilis TaxID=981085 RepID=UPI000CED6600|nr:LEAF RUST 10 DISEASE-RESISTANCE LOCUS RECEPTOR-LIKE PROTEIN KINASE-like 1.1 isoform X2 [Morus notabilis]